MLFGRLRIDLRKIKMGIFSKILAQSSEFLDTWWILVSGVCIIHWFLSMGSF